MEVEGARHSSPKPLALLYRLEELRYPKTNDRDGLLKKIGAAEKEAGSLARLIEITLRALGEPINAHTFHWRIQLGRYRRLQSRDGRYLLRTKQSAHDPTVLWNQYMTLTEVEEAFRNLKGDLAIRPIHHRLESRIEAHIFISFLAYCLHVTLRQMAKTRAPGLTPRSIWEQMRQIQMVDIYVPTTDGRELRMSRYTTAEKPHLLLLAQLQLQLPPQPPPEISSVQARSCDADLFEKHGFLACFLVTQPRMGKVRPVGRRFNTINPIAANGPHVGYDLHERGRFIDIQSTKMHNMTKIDQAFANESFGVAGF